MTAARRFDFQPAMTFVGAVAVLLGGLGLAGFMGPPWPPRLTVLPLVAFSALTALVGRAKLHTRIIQAGAAVVGTGLALAGLYFYCRWRERVDVVECLIPATGGIVVAIILNDGLNRLRRVRLAAALASTLGVGVFVASLLLLP